MVGLTRNHFWILTVFALSAAFLYMSLGGHSVAVNEVSVAEARALIDTRRAAILDVRAKEAFDKGHIPGAITVPAGELAQRVEALGLDKARPVLVYCGDGLIRGSDATRILNARGYDGAVNLRGGFEGWQAAGLPVTR